MASCLVMVVIQKNSEIVFYYFNLIQLRWIIKPVYPGKIQRPYYIFLI